MAQTKGRLESLQFGHMDKRQSSPPFTLADLREWKGLLTPALQVLTIAFDSEREYALDGLLPFMEDLVEAGAHQNLICLQILVRHSSMKWDRNAQRHPITNGLPFLRELRITFDNKWSNRSPPQYNACHIINLVAKCPHLQHVNLHDWSLEGSEYSEWDDDTIADARSNDGTQVELDDEAIDEMTRDLKELDTFILGLKYGMEGINTRGIVKVGKNSPDMKDLRLHVILDLAPLLQHLDHTEKESRPFQKLKFLKVNILSEKTFEPFYGIKDRGTVSPEHVPALLSELLPELTKITFKKKVNPDDRNTRTFVERIRAFERPFEKCEELQEWIKCHRSRLDDDQQRAGRAGPGGYW